MNELKVRIGESLNLDTNEVVYQLQFKFSDERTFKGLSFDVFPNKDMAKIAMAKHKSGERKYTYLTSLEEVKRKVKGNCVYMSKDVKHHILTAEPMEGAITWFELND